jgi:hypothetical protein
VSEAELEEGRVYPNLNRIQEVSLAIAVDVGKYALSKNLCHLHPAPAPEQIAEIIKSQVYNPVYTNALNTNWAWPKL